MMRILGAILGYRVQRASAALDEARRRVVALADFEALLQERDGYMDRAHEAVKAANALQATADKLEADNAGLIMRVRNLQATIALLEAVNETEGPKRDLEKSNDAQAARAMSRNTKQAFVAYQEGVKAILGELDKVCRKNSFTVRDLDKVQNVRRELRAILKREI